MQQIIETNITDLIPADYNPRMITEKEEADLKQSLERFGFLDPMIVNSNPERKNTIICGHQRLKVWAKMGHTTVPVIFVDLSYEKEREFNIRHNKNTGEWDFAILKSFFEEDELENWGFEKEELSFGFGKDPIDPPSEGEDDIPAEAPAITQKGDIYILGGKHRLLCGDSTLIDDCEKLMDGSKADMAFMDPPYGVNYSSKNEYLNLMDKGNRIQNKIENDDMNLSDTSDFIYNAFVNIKLSLAKRSSYYFTAPQGGDLMMMMMMMMMMQKADIPLRHCLIWAKNNHVLGRCDYNYKHEPILFGWCDVHDFYGKGIHKFSVWDIDKPLKNDLHPTMKPIELIENALLNSTIKENIVIDFFLGSGSTLIAAEKTGRKCYGIEIDQHYCDVIVKRYVDFCHKNKIESSVIRNGDVCHDFDAFTLAGFEKE